MRKRRKRRDEEDGREQWELLGKGQLGKERENGRNIRKRKEGLRREGENGGNY